MRCRPAAQSAATMPQNSTKVKILLCIITKRTAQSGPVGQAQQLASIASTAPLEILKRCRRRVGLRGNLENKPAPVEISRTKFKADVEIKRTKDVVKTTRILLGVHMASMRTLRSGVRLREAQFAWRQSRYSNIGGHRWKSQERKSTWKPASLRGKLDNEI